MKSITLIRTLTLCICLLNCTAILAEVGEGERLFKLHCARCHGMRGGGGTGANLRRPKLQHIANDADLRRVIKGGIPGTGMPGNWFMTDREVRDTTAFVRSLGRRRVEPVPGNAKLGMQIYQKSECAECHIIRGRGGSSGPVLTEVGTQRGLEFLRTAVLHPAKDSPRDQLGYREYLVTIAVTEDGRVVTGTRINEDTFTIQIRDEQNRIHSLRKRDLDSLTKTDRSAMPSYQEKLTSRDIDHLVSFLASLRGNE